MHGALVSFLVGACALATPVGAALAADPDSITVTAGAHYHRSGFHRFFFGTDYRTIWSTPVRVPV
ncbi:MAG TPA: hypothetical protein VHU20_10385, partial [Candidatus Eisenbacteria bacterium]|nr:hypothetical protein [Candidatus Eisenbacteria bacterium]